MFFNHERHNGIAIRTTRVASCGISEDMATRYAQSLSSAGALRRGVVDDNDIDVVQSSQQLVKRGLTQQPLKP